MVVTELPSDIPPWSPLARRARESTSVLVDAAADSTTDTTADGVKAGLTGSEIAGSEGPAPEVDTGTDPETPAVPEPAPEPEPTPTGSGVLTALAAGTMGGLVVALVVAVSIFATAGGTGDPAPTTTVRTPLPSTSAGNPAPAGTRVALGNGWTALVRGWDRDSTDVVVELNPGSTLAEGEQYLVIDLELAYVDGGPDAESPFYGVDVTLVTDDGIAITPADAPCTPPGPAFDLTSELARGQAQRGLLCFPVDGSQVESPQLVLEPSMTFGSTPSHLGLVAPS